MHGFVPLYGQHSAIALILNMWILYVAIFLSGLLRTCGDPHPHSIRFWWHWTLVTPRHPVYESITRINMIGSLQKGTWIILKTFFLSNEKKFILFNFNCLIEFISKFDVDWYLIWYNYTFKKEKIIWKKKPSFISELHF